MRTVGGRGEGPTASPPPSVEAIRRSVQGAGAVRGRGPAGCVTSADGPGVTEGSEDGLSGFVSVTQVSDDRAAGSLPLRIPGVG